MLLPSPVLPHLLPSADEGVDVVDGGDVPVPQRRALEEGVLVASHDAPVRVLDVRGQRGLGVPEGLGRPVLPHHHAEAEQRGALGEHAIVGLRHLPRAHVAEDRAVPAARGRAQLAAGEVLVLLVAGVPLELRELPVRHGHVGATLGLPAVVARPSAVADRRHVGHRLVDLGDHFLQRRLLRVRSTQRRVEARGELLGLPERLREEGATLVLGNEEGLLASVVLLAPVAATLGGARVHRDDDRGEVQRLVALEADAGQVHAHAHGGDVVPNLVLIIRGAFQLALHDIGGGFRLVVHGLRGGLGLVQRRLLRLPLEDQLVRRLLVLLGLRDVRLGVYGGLLGVGRGLFRVGDRLFRALDPALGVGDLCVGILHGLLRRDRVGLHAVVQVRRLLDKLRGRLRVGAGILRQRLDLRGGERRDGDLPAVLGFVARIELRLPRLVVAAVPGIDVAVEVVRCHPTVAARGVGGTAVRAAHVVAKQHPILEEVHTDGVHARLDEELLARL
mmetsp:Transcript_4368/g.12148  ORF Transcript_4368/g.12148 Transcript_4368/m.12148 type:complete len:503 (-) Transcript_4368:2158-3666(-)